MGGRREHPAPGSGAFCCGRQSDQEEICGCRSIIKRVNTHPFEFSGTRANRLGGRESSSHLVAFLLGAILPTAFLFFLASDRLGSNGLSSSISMSCGCSNQTQTQQQSTGPRALESDNTTTTSSSSTTTTTTTITTDDQEVGFAGLAELLPRVAMEDRTVILTLVNEAYAQPGSLLDIYLESFRNGENIEHLLNHLLVIAVDAGGFGRCKAVHPHCYLMEVKSTTNLRSATGFMTKEFVEMVWLKLTFQQRILELGYSFLFTDADMIWLHNPFRHISVYADMSLSTDKFWDGFAPINNTLNTGLYHMKSTNRSVEVIRYWRAARARFPGGSQQVVFNEIKHELVAKFQARIEAVETLYFSGFCEYHADLNKACTMHADCCIGLENKVPSLRDAAADWKNYTMLSPEEKMKGEFKWTFPARCWKSIGWDA